VVGRDEHAVRGGQGPLVERDARVTPTAPLQLRHVGIVILDQRLAALQLMDDLERRGLADVVDVPLVADAQHENPRAVQGLAPLVERVGDEGDHRAGHRAVDLMGEVNEARFEAGQARLPGEVEGVDGDAVPAQAGPRVEGHEPEGLAGGRVDDLPDVDAQGAGHEGDLVDEADVDGADGVLQELDHLGGLGRGDGDDVGSNVAVEAGGEVGAGWGDPPHHAGDGGGGMGPCRQG
jgi:hypothetical protein